MRVTLKLAIPLLCALTLMAQGPWQQITVPTLREAAANFKTPPREYGAIQPFLSWNGPDAKEIRARIVRDLDRLSANGVFVFNLSPGRGEPKYLSPEHMAQVKFVVEEAKKRGMKLWIQDECDYPSGMAGGLINTEYPQLRMQAIVADIRASVAAGQTLTIPMPPGTLGAFSVKGSDQTHRGDSTPRRRPVRVDRAERGFRSEPTQLAVDRRVCAPRLPQLAHAVQQPRRTAPDTKDGLYSLIDYLDPEATHAFMKLMHETYKQAVGDEFGKTILGFRGDETDYTGFIPWTPKLLEEFQKQKGYDLKPYIPLFFWAS